MEEKKQWKSKGEKGSARNFAHKKNIKSRHNHNRKLMRLESIPQFESTDEKDSELSEAQVKPQSTLRLQRFNESDSEECEDTGKNFESLLNVPLSENSHFVLKSEKTWTVDTSQYSNLFSLNLKELAAAVNCIPFTEYINVEDTYFTQDQLTRINNVVEDAKKHHQMSDSRVQDNELRLTASKVVASKEDKTTDDLEEDLDFLLSLDEPLERDPTTMPSMRAHQLEDTKSPLASTTKSIDLERWLDSVLDD